MESFENKWKKHFEEQVSSKNTTLIPRKEIFHEVKKEAMKKEKKRKFVFFWLLGFLLLLVAFSWYVKSDSIFENANTGIESPHKTPNSQTAEIHPSISNQTKSTEYTNKSNRLEEMRQHTSIQEIKQVDLNNKKKAVQSADKKITPKNDVFSKQQSLTSDKINSSSRSNNRFIKESESEDHSNVHSSKNDVISSGEEIGTGNYTHRLISTRLDPIPITQLAPITTVQVIELPESAAIKSLKKKKKYTAWALSLASQLISWEDQLNNAYNAVLNPADFHSASKPGYGLSLSASKSVGTKLALMLGGSINRIRSISGHNSNTTYDIQAEITPLHNNKKLTLGTPYGLIESEVTLRRSNEVNENQAVAIDVDSRHEFFVFTLQAALQYSIISNSTWSLSLSTGPELSFLSRMNNEVTFSTISSDNIDIAQSIILDNQQNLRSYLIFWKSGINLSKKVSDRIDLNTSIQYAYGITPTFSVDDLKSYASYYAVGLGLAWNL